MDRERDAANVMGQVAGMIAVMSAVVDALPPSTRKRLPLQLHTRFEALITAMSTTRGTEAAAVTEGAEWVRDLFLAQIAKSDQKQKSRKTTGPADDALDIQF